MRLLETKPCDICGSTEYDVLYRYERDFYDHEVYETCSWDGRQSIDLEVVTCRECRTSYARPSFREEALDLVYPSDLIPAQPDLARLVERRDKHDQMVASLARVLSGGVVCDVGTRYGVMPEKARRAGFDAFGIDSNAQTVQAGRAAGLPVEHAHLGSLSEVLARRHLDRVHAFTLDDVVEHLAYPTRDLRELARFQEAGDLLLLRQMDLDSLGHRRYGRDWYYVQPAAHMYYYDAASLTRLVAKVGYEVCAIERAHRWKNLASLTARDGWHLLARALRLAPRRRKWLVKGKQMYLVERRKSPDDMFLVVARKRALRTAPP
jgi:2-polyprenyl-3-methyl-5-hydroxy-6-metoxy-1,4-benzoquinol methylase